MPWSVRRRAPGGAPPPTPWTDPSPPAQPALDLAASQRECLDLDAELSAIALRTAERALTLSAASQRVRDLASFLQEALDLGADLDEIIRRAARRARKLTGADGVVVEAADGTGKVHRTRAGTSAAVRSRGGRVVPDHPWRAPVASTVQVCSDTETDPRVDREACERLGARALITAPQRHRDVSLGAITVTASRPRAFDEAQLAGLQVLANQVTSAAARLYLTVELNKIDRERLSALVTGEAMFRRLFYQNPQPMLVLDTETRRILAVNDAACATYGYSAEEFSTLTIAALRTDPAQLDADFDRARAGDTSFAAQHRARDGHVLDVEPPPDLRCSTAARRSSRSSRT
ncbi:MAG: GAF domain-containing protein [Candidatus Dormibacteria bacterium]